MDDDWETQLTRVDNNRIVVRSIGPRLDAQLAGPQRRSAGQTSGDLLKYFSSFNDHIIQDSDNFYSYKKPTDFRLEHREVQVFSTREAPTRAWKKKSAVPTPTFSASPRRWQRLFPKIIWSTRAGSLPAGAAPSCFYPTGMPMRFLTTHCAGAELDGHCSPAPVMPYHDIRRPAEIDRADYAVSANIGRTLDSVRQE